MEFRIFIVCVACFSCVVPDVLSAPFLAKGAVIGKGLALAKGALALKAAAIGKGVMLTKGALALKGAAIGKGVMLAKGALALKGAAIGKGVMLAKGALALKGAAIGKGVMLAKGAVAGALAAKGALIAKSVMAAKGALALKKALAAKGVMLAKGAVSAVIAKGAAAVAAKAAAAAAAAKGATLLAKAKSTALLAAKGALGGAVVTAGGAALAKFEALSNPESIVRVPALVSTASPFGRPSLTINELFYQAAEHPRVLSPVAEVAGVVGRVAGWAGAIQNAMVNQSNTASDLVGALTRRVAFGSSPVPVAYRSLRAAPRFYPAPIVEKLETA